MTSKNLSRKIWTEEYRPKNLNDLCLSDDTKHIISNFGKNIPNLLFCGVQGAGKTSLARIIVQDILNCDYLYINASDESGVDTIRTKVSGFAQTKSLDGELKVIILDEADYLSSSSQAALRNMMETHHDNTRFILTGNYKHRIIPAIQSRCQSLDIYPTLKSSILRCFYILEQENINTNLEEKKQIAIIIKKFFPDLRKTINELQKISGSGKIQLPSITDNSNILDYILKNLKSGNTLEIRKFLIEHEFDFNSDWDQLLVDFLNYIYSINDLNDSNKKEMIMTIADHLDKSARVIDKEINFFACVLNLEQSI